MGEPNHKITVCTSCKHKGDDVRPGHKLIEQLRAAIDAAGTTLGGTFDVSGIACMAGCDQPCTVAYHGQHKATYLFGGVEPGQDIDDLVTFARQYAGMGDGWCSSVDRPGKLRTHTIARVPALALPVDDSTAPTS